jgi:RNA polymerase sigma-70 factor (ECF subfamily)
VLSAGQTNSPEADTALARLCQSYWYPLYVYVRRLGHSHEDAQDLVQGFFARVLEKNYLKSADPNKGRFRSFLLVMLKGFMSNEWDRTNRQKRGGGVQIVSLNADDTETRYLAEPIDEMTPEKAYDQHWATLLLSRVLDRLEKEFLAASKATVFDELKVFLTGEKSESTYSEIGQRIGMSEGNLKVTVHRLRQRYRELLRGEIADTVDGPEAIDEEIRHLFAALG